MKAIYAGIIILVVLLLGAHIFSRNLPGKYAHLEEFCSKQGGTVVLDINAEPVCMPHRPLIPPKQ